MAESKEESRQNMKPEVKQGITPENMPIRKDLLNNAQVAAILGIRVDTVTRLIKRGTLPKHNVVLNQRLKFWSVDFIKGFLKVEVSN